MCLMASTLAFLVWHLTICLICIAHGIIDIFVSCSCTPYDPSICSHIIDFLTTYRPNIEIEYLYYQWSIGYSRQAGVSCSVFSHKIAIYLPNLPSCLLTFGIRNNDVLNTMEKRAKREAVRVMKVLRQGGVQSWQSSLKSLSLESGGVLFFLFLFFFLDLR